MASYADPEEQIDHLPTNEHCQLVNFNEIIGLIYLPKRVWQPFLFRKNPVYNAKGYAWTQGIQGPLNPEDESHQSFSCEIFLREERLKYRLFAQFLSCTAFAASTAAILLSLQGAWQLPGALITSFAFLISLLFLKAVIVFASHSRPASPSLRLVKNFTLLSMVSSLFLALFLAFVGPDAATAILSITAALVLTAAATVAFDWIRDRLVIRRIEARRSLSRLDLFLELFLARSPLLG